MFQTLAEGSPFQFNLEDESQLYAHRLVHF